MTLKRQPCPDPEYYVWVNTATGGYWRRRRGTVKKAKLNKVLSGNAKLTPVANDAAKRIRAKLDPFLGGLSVGRIQANLGGKLKKAYNHKGYMDYSFMKGMNMQPFYPLERLIKDIYSIEVTSDCVTVRIPVYEHSVDNTGALVTDYYFELILLEGDPAKTRNSLRTDVDTSPLYAIGSKAATIELCVHPTRSLWMVLLKLNTLETETLSHYGPAASPSNYGMKVIAVS